MRYLADLRQNSELTKLQVEVQVEERERKRRKEGREEVIHDMLTSQLKHDADLMSLESCKNLIIHCKTKITELQDDPDASAA